MPITEQFREMLGEPGTSAAPVVEEFGKKGLRISRGIVSGLRHGYEGGTRLQVEYDSRESLIANDPSIKLQFLTTFLDVASELQAMESPDSRHFVLRGLADGIGEQVGIKGKQVSEIVKIMRADVAYSESVLEDTDSLKDSFEAIASGFYNRRDSRGRKGGKSVREVIDVWAASDERNLADFYRLLYHRGTYAIASWFSSEIPFFAEYYENHPEELSPLDKRVLNGAVSRTPRKDFAQEIHEETGVPYTDDLFAIHRDIVVYGAPSIKPV